MNNICLIEPSFTLAYPCHVTDGLWISWSLDEMEVHPVASPLQGNTNAKTIPLSTTFIYNVL